jgi:hypothetical protein
MQESGIAGKLKLNTFTNTMIWEEKYEWMADEILRNRIEEAASSKGIPSTSDFIRRT